MSRLFVTDKEKRFFDSITKELIQKIICQKVIYYAISDEHTNTHRLYDESIRKTTFRPVEVNALVLFDDPIQNVGEFSIDTVWHIEVYFNVEELKERNLIAREGDFLKFGDITYEIEKLTQPQIVYGQIEKSVMIKSVCRSSRKGQFEVLDNLPGY